MQQLDQPRSSNQLHSPAFKTAFAPVQDYRRGKQEMSLEFFGKECVKQHFARQPWNDNCRASHTGDACRGRGRERGRGISSELGKNRHCRRCRRCRRCRCCRRLRRRRRRRRRRRCYCCYSCCCLVLLSLSLLSL